MLKHVFEEIQFRPDKLNKVNLFKNPRFFCDVYCMEAGQEQKAHTHEAEDKVYYVLSGCVEFLHGEATVRGTAGDTLWATAGVPHGVRNPGPDRATLLVFMAPHPRAGELKDAT